MSSGQGFLRCVRALAATALAVLAGLLVSAPALAQEAEPAISVIDGDTLEIDGRALRLFGIDAPELGQTCLNAGKRWRCGLQAAVELRQLLETWKELTCETAPLASAGNVVICHDPQYNDPAEVLLARGLALALPDSFPAYKRAQNQAKLAKLGLWRGEFLEPAIWRMGHRLPGPEDSPAEICDVKGTISEKGNKVYYVPTDANYEKFEIDPERGERWFCSDDEAELAGWRHFPRK